MILTGGWKNLKNEEKLVIEGELPGLNESLKFENALNMQMKKNI